MSAAAKSAIFIVGAKRTPFGEFNLLTATTTAPNHFNVPHAAQVRSEGS